MKIHLAVFVWIVSALSLFAQEASVHLPQDYKILILQNLKKTHPEYRDFQVRYGRPEPVDVIDADKKVVRAIGVRTSWSPFDKDGTSLDMTVREDFVFQFTKMLRLKQSDELRWPGGEPVNEKLNKKPNQALLPTPTSVTDRAAHAPRQP